LQPNVRALMAGGSQVDDDQNGNQGRTEAEYDLAHDYAPLGSSQVTEARMGRNGADPAGLR
jgi:hypothetical protein